MIDPIEQALSIVDLHREQSSEAITYALVEAGLVPTRGEWGVLDAGRVRTFGSEESARRYADKHGQKVVHYWTHDWQIVE